MRAFFRSFLVRWLVVLMLSPALASAQAVPSRMQSAISSLIQSKGLKRGFAANDPRIGSTLQSAGSTVAGAAVSAAVVTAAGVTAPAWITAGIGVGLAALFSVGIDLAIDGIRWLINGDGSVSSVATSQPYNGQRNWADGQYVDAIRLNDYCQPDINGTNGTVGGTLPFNYWCAGRGTAGHAAAPGESPMPMNASIMNNGASAPGPQVGANLPSAISSLTSDQQAKPVNPQLLATLADTAWKQAASQPGYSGLPYDASDPITAVDAQALQQSSPSAWPTVGDAVSPQASTNPDASASPWSLPAPSTSGSTSPGTGTSTNPGTSTGTTPSSQPIDWGTFSPPALEETPTVGSILDPLFNLWPAWTSFSFPQHQSVCPTPSVTLPATVINGATLHFTQMCDFLEANNVRYAMQAAFAVAWAIVIVFIVMGA